MRDYAFHAARIFNTPLLIDPGKAHVILDGLRDRLNIAADFPAPTPENNRFMGSWRRKDGHYARFSPEVSGVAIVSIVGTLVNRGEYIGNNSGVVSYEGIGAQIRDAAEQPSVRAIVLDMQSPGGEAGGMYDLADLIRTVATRKPVVAMIADYALSAGYGLASAAREIVVSPTSLVGSIGTLMIHMDHSGELEAMGRKPTIIYHGARKVDGHPFGPLTDRARAEFEGITGAHYDRFVEAVAAGRGSRLTADKARATKAAVYFGQQAVDAGLADRIGNIDEVVGSLAAKPAIRGKRPTTEVHMDNENGAPTAENAGITEAQATERVNAAVVAERTRMSSILTSAEAAGREAMAIKLALTEGLTAEAATGLLADMPKAGGSIAVDTDAGIGQDDPKPNKGAETDAVWARTLNKLNGKKAAA